MADSVVAAIRPAFVQGLLTALGLCGVLGLALAWSAFRERGSGPSARDPSVGEPSPREPSSGEETGPAGASPGRVADGPGAPAGIRSSLARSAGVALGTGLAVPVLLGGLWVAMAGLGRIEGPVEEVVRPHATTSDVQPDYEVVVDGRRHEVPRELHRVVRPGDTLRRGRLALWYHHDGRMVAHEGKVFFLGLAGGLLVALWLAFAVFVARSG